MNKASSFQPKLTYVTPSLVIMIMYVEKGFAGTGDGDNEGYTDKEGAW